jgi:hypothetical protein
MKKRSIFTVVLITLFFAGQVFAQTKTANISFEKTAHNFGTIKEEGGPVSYEFKLTNTGGSYLKISNVKASCGCTTPDWSRDSIAPGKAGFVKATYDPRNRPGGFNKSITVTSNAEQPSLVLTISGDVTPRVKTVEDFYPQLMDSIRLKSNHIAFVKIKNTEVKTDTMEIINVSKSMIAIGFDKVPPHIKLKAVPATLKPDEKGLIIATYDGTVQKDYGFIIDRVDILFNQKMTNPNNRLSVSATIEEDFSKLTPQQLADAPAIEFENMVYDYDTIKQGDIKEYDFKFSNKGKTDLILRKVKASCGCTATAPAETTIKGGASSTIKITFNSSGKTGNQNKTITVISNDPKNPNITLSVKGYILAPPTDAQPNK